jgi:hypothetical protein
MSQKATFYLMCLVVALIGVLLFAMPSKAQQPQRTIVCDTAEQIENVSRRVFEKREPPGAAVEAVNAGTNACGMLIFVPGSTEEVKVLTLGEHTLAILRVQILAIGLPTPMGLQMQPAELVHFVVMHRTPKNTDA